MLTEERVREIIKEELQKGSAHKRNPYRYIAREVNYAVMYEGKPVAYGDHLGSLISSMGIGDFPRGDSIIDCRTGTVAFVVR